MRTKHSQLDRMHDRMCADLTANREGAREDGNWYLDRPTLPYTHPPEIPGPHGVVRKGWWIPVQYNRCPVSCVTCLCRSRPFVGKRKVGGGGGCSFFFGGC